MKYVPLPSYVSKWCEQYVWVESVVKKQAVEHNDLLGDSEREMLSALSKIGAHVVRCYQADAYRVFDIDSDTDTLLRFTDALLVDDPTGSSGTEEVNLKLNVISDVILELKTLITLGNEFGAVNKFETVVDLVIFLLNEIATGSMHPKSPSRELLVKLGLVANTHLHETDAPNRLLSSELKRSIEAKL